MGLGGNWAQDQLSMRAGSTYGDLFLVNIDDPADPAAQLEQIIRSGHAVQLRREREPAKTLGVDLDRTLHHEERHSQQWAQLGPVEFGRNT